MRLKKLKTGQTVLEYTILVIIILAAFVTTSVYLKRGIQGRWRDAIDQLGEQYDPTVMISNIHYSLSGNTETWIKTTDQGSGFWTNRIDISNMVETKTGGSQAAAY